MSVRICAAKTWFESSKRPNKFRISSASTWKARLTPSGPSTSSLRSTRSFSCQVGTVIQSYLYRSEKDIQELSRMGCSIRLCKGAYMEPPEVAFPKKADVDRNYTRLLDQLLVSPAYTAIATHDDAMIDHALRFLSKNDVAASKYEFQMLYGVRRESQLRLARQGYKMRVYVPYGRHWAPYYMRRLAERPANVFFIARNFFRR